MSQVDFFLSEKERLEFIQYCFKHGCNIIPNQHYNTDKYLIASNMEQYEKYCKKSPLLFITSNKFSMHSLELDYFEVDDKRRYFIKQRYGGPTIDFFSPVIGELEDNVVGPGHIGIYPFYYHGSKRFVPNKFLTEFYKLFTIYIKGSCQKIKLTQRTFWVGNATIDRAKKEEIKLLPISNINLLTLLEQSKENNQKTSH
jgi:hypothetical protein